MPSVPGPTISPLTAIPRSRDSWLRTRELKTSWTGHGWVQSSVVPSIVVGGGEIIDGHMAIFISFEHVIQRSDPNHLEAQRRRRHRLFFYRSVFSFTLEQRSGEASKTTRKKGLSPKLSVPTVVIVDQIAHAQVQGGQCQLPHSCMSCAPPSLICRTLCPSPGAV